MVEQPDASECHGDAVLVAGHDDVVVADAAAGLCDELDAALVGPLDVVAEGEEGVGAEADAAHLLFPQLLLLAAEGLGALGEEELPLSVAQHVVVLVVREEDVDGVVAVGAAYAGLEGQAEHAGVLTEPPLVGFLSGEARAVDAALLSGTDADGLSVGGVADAVRLGILQGDECDDEVAACLRRERLVLRGDVVEGLGVVEAYLVASLLEGDAEDLLVLQRCGAIVGVDADDVVGALALLAEHL